MQFQPLSIATVVILFVCLVLCSVGVGIPMWYSTSASFTAQSSKVTLTIHNGLFKACTKVTSSFANQDQCQDAIPDTYPGDQPYCPEKATPTIGGAIAALRATRAFTIMTCLVLGVGTIYRAVGTFLPALAASHPQIFALRIQCYATAGVCGAAALFTIIALACYYGITNTCDLSFCERQKLSLAAFAGESWSCGMGASFGVVLTQGIFAVGAAVLAVVQSMKAPTAASEVSSATAAAQQPMVAVQHAAQPQQAGGAAVNAYGSQPAPPAAYQQQPPLPQRQGHNDANDDIDML